MTRLKPFLPLILGALAGLGFAPLGWWPLTLACFAAWLWLVYDAPTLRRALLAGWTFGVGHFTIDDNWIARAFDFQDNMPHVLGYGAVVLLALYLAVYPMLAAGLAWRLASPRSRGDGATPPGPPFALVAGAAWIATEWLRAELFTGYAWDPLGVVWVALLPAARIATWIGTYALSGVTVVLAGALMLAFARRFRFAGTVVALFVAAACFGIERPAPPVAHPGAWPDVRIVQPDLGEDNDPGADFDERNLESLIALTGRPQPGAPPRLIVWPEGAVRYFLEDGYPRPYYWEGYPAETRARIAATLGPRDVVLTGGDALQFDARGNLSTASNSIFAVDARGQLLGRYDKAHLVPYGEYLPARPVLSLLGLSRLVPGDIDFVSGPGPATLPIAGFGRIGMQICYEIVFSGQVVDEAHRPRLLFNPSNDSWFGRWGPPQHLAQARMRAIEEGVPILRATPTGISAVIAADGRLLATIAPHIAGTIERPMPDIGPPTLFARTGNWMALIVALILSALAVAMRRRAD